MHIPFFFPNGKFPIPRWSSLRSDNSLVSPLLLFFLPPGVPIETVGGGEKKGGERESADAMHSHCVHLNDVDGMHDILNYVTRTTHRGFCVGS